MKQKILTLTTLLFISIMSFGQGAQITGTVKGASDGVPLPGVNIIVKGTTNGVQTDFDGNYSITAAVGDVIQFSYLGMTDKEVTVGSDTVINVQLEEDAEQLEDVVVTALGIKKTRKSLTYAAQDIKADELTKIKDANPINSLSGKVSGLVVNRSSSGVGGSVKVTLRGNTSTRNNQPLYVIDGIPLLNTTAIQPNSTFGDINNAGNRDGGDALSLINPDDIESISILKGASASALYGSQGSNGVILITTKKGKAGTFKVDVSSNLTVDEVAYQIDFDPATERNVDSFFQTGTTVINSASVSGGGEKAQTYFSYANTQAKGVIPTHQVKKHTLNLRETAKLFDDRLTVDANVILSTQDIHNKPVSALYFNPLRGAYAFRSDTETLSNYEVFEEFNVERNLMAQRWFGTTSDVEQNPYWILNRNASDEENQKAVLSLSLSYKVNNWLTLKTRGSYDKNFYKFERKMFATTNGTLAATTGRYLYNEVEDLQLYGDFIATINTSLSDDWNITANIGASLNKFDTGKSILLDSGVTGGLQVPNIFTLSNFNANPGIRLIQTQAELKEVQSIFASSTLGFKQMVYLDVTARNDWSSTVSDSFFYPSIGLTGVVSEMFELPEVISFAKVRASYAEVGKDIQSFVNNPIFTIATGEGGIIPPNTLPLSELKPEKQRSFEVGTEWKFLNNRLGFDFGYYKTNTIDQFMIIPGVISDFSSVNAGDFENSGFELSLSATPVETENFTWNTTVNFASNKNEVLELDSRLSSPFIELTNPGVNAYGLYIIEGGSFGDIYGRKLLKTAEGLPVRAADGNFVQADAVNDGSTRETLPNGLDFLGNANPDFTLGWSNSFSYKNITLGFLIDGKFGGEVMSMTEAVVDQLGNTNRTGNVTIFDQGTNSSVQIPASEYYAQIGGRNGFTSEYVYDATNIRLAEVSLGYTFNLKESSFFNAVRASLIGRNLFFISKDAPYDPNVTLSTGNGLQGVDVFGAPSTRSIGLNIGLSF
ncbi:TonB-linked SusC/RagA family outer membrane protein [Aquimarina sp. MAR_2010_214]|uniref:carboxypeptidase-like regulatory domain-containing protein n=1 Tax=Aquimarina sp. MAR_2010_214 TaxID=1250026 RepID=UPI000C712DD8|nr:carboxypeptidase-like regulatory domain-containing protein [Aquimarina sp. MAR_2010_214]PKV50301.1 TonB-linked SusC/RagA family outer membrane protein [Aquimarina sp. MAR_2010_214]